MNLLTLPLLLAQASESAPDITPEGTPPGLTPEQGAALAAMMGTILLIGAVVGVFFIICMWKIFTKAGQPGWASLIPIYNLYILCKIAGKSGWWVIWCSLFFIPYLFLCISLAERFGKGAGFGVGLFFLSPIFLPILAFDSSRYQGAGAAPLPGAAY